MDYRLKYRDIPWRVALGVLPGKLIGSFFIKPYIKFMYRWRNIISSNAKHLLVVIAICLVIALAFSLVDVLSGNGLIVEVFNNIS